MGGLASFLSGLIGGAGDAIQKRKAQQLQQQVQTLAAQRQALMTVMNSPDATPQAKAAALQALLQSGQPQQTSKKGKNQQPQQGGLDSILSAIITGGPAAPQQNQAAPQAGSQLPKVSSMPQGPFYSPEQIAQKKADAEAAAEKARLRGEYDEQLAEGKEQGLTGDALQEYALTGKVTKPKSAFEQRVSEADELGLQGADRVNYIAGKVIEKPAPKSPRDTAKVIEQSGIPTGVQWTDDKGTHYAAKGKDAPPEIKAMYNEALAAHQQARQEKADDEARIADLAQKRADRALTVSEQKQADAQVIKKVGVYEDIKAKGRAMQTDLNAALAGNPQAQQRILFNYIGATISAQRGARVTMAEITQAAKARSLPEDLQVLYDKQVTGAVLDKDQIQRMVDSIGSSVDSSLQEVRDTADDLGVDLTKVAPGIKSGLQQSTGAIKTADQLLKKYGVPTN